MAQLRVHTNAWVVIGDGKKALVLRNEGDADLLNLRRVSVREDTNPATHEQGTDAPGTAAGPGARRGGGGSTDWHQMGEDRFTATMAAAINEAARTQQFREVIIVAPPKVLGELRKELNGQAQKLVVAEIDKDLTHHTIPEIEKLLPTYPAR